MVINKQTNEYPYIIITLYEGYTIYVYYRHAHMQNYIYRKKNGSIHIIIITTQTNTKYSQYTHI